MDIKKITGIEKDGKIFITLYGTKYEVVIEKAKEPKEDKPKEK